MKTFPPCSRRPQQGTALTMTMIMTGVALAILASTMSWSANSTRLTHRTIQYHRAVAAAEAATEKVLSQVTRDYLNGGLKQVTDNLANYRLIVPTGTDSSYWSNWEFNDTATAGRTSVQAGAATNYVLANTAYAGLRAFATTYQVASHARLTGTTEDVIGGVLQELHLAQIPIFQFAMYSSSDMEISCGQEFTIIGRVHSNGKLYVEPDNKLTFQSDVTSVRDILFARHPNDSRGNPGGSVVYQVEPKTPVSALTLPIGMSNSPTAIREILQPPPDGEDPNSPLGQQRFYNQAKLIVVVSNDSVTATSGRFNNFATTIPTNEVAAMVVTTNRFGDKREGKTVRPIDINIAAFTKWGETNLNINTVAGTNGVNSIYVLDRRTLAGSELGAVRVFNGTNLPVSGLSIATARPLYVWGNFNQTNSVYLGTNYTAGTRPAAFMADAITVLSGAWRDSASSNSVSGRVAASTTVNAAFLTGVVETAGGKYSGGMENFPRFLESWGSANVFTYNGSMVKMFPSLYATNTWNNNNDIYAPPKRNWAYDVNFSDPSKIPPMTPKLLTVLRGQWATLPPDQNYASAMP
jgi:hypothetical protein